MLVRFFDKPGLDNKLRISVGAREENEALLAAIDAALAESRSETTTRTEPSVAGPGLNLQSQDNVRQ